MGRKSGKLTQALEDNEVETEYHVVKTWGSFTDIFGKAKEVKAMTLLRFSSNNTRNT